MGYEDFLVDIILNNARLSYTDENKLMIDEDKAIMEVVKVISRKKYENRLNELKELKGLMKNEETKEC